MKKINKLMINSEKIIKNEELLSLKGGDSGTMCINCIDILSQVIGGYYTNCGTSYTDGMFMCNFYYSGVEGWFGTCGVNCGAS